MKRVFGVALVALMVFTLSATAVTAHSDRPFWGWSSGTITFDLENPKGCEAGITTTTHLPAFTSHLGLSHLMMLHCPVDLSVVDGELALVAANGDTLQGTYWGVVTPSEDFSVFYAEIWIDFAGGTGRFDDAEGWAVMDVVVPFGGEVLAWPGWSATWSGRLTY